jgi:hypothetical protein
MSQTSNVFFENTSNVVTSNGVAPIFRTLWCLVFGFASLDRFGMNKIFVITIKWSRLVVFGRHFVLAIQKPDKKSGF